MKLSPQAEWGRAEAAAREIAAAEAAFARLPKGDVLLGYQARAVNKLFAGVSLLVIEKSRRIGLTWGLAAYAVMKAGAQPSAGGMNAWYMGYDMEMAREFIDACAMWARAFGSAAEASDEELLDGDVQAFRIRFASGFKIVALPSVPRALRGKQGLVIIDEAAFHKDLAEVLKAALALLMWGGQVVVVSTHDGIANPFNLLLDDVRGGRRKGEPMTITFNQAIEDGLFERIAMMAELKGRPLELGKAEWIADIRDTYGDDAEEELDCVPKEGSGSWLDPAALAACEHPDAGRPELYGGGLYYMGRDIARRRDLAVIHGFEEVGDVLWLRDRWLGRAATFQAQDDEAGRLIRSRRMVRYWLDQTGMGEPIVESEQRRYGETRVQGVLLTGPNRLDLAIALKERVDACKLRVPPRPELRTDFRAIKKKGGIAGSITLVNEGDVHADEFWAAGLACGAARTPYQPYAYEAVSGRDMSGESPLARRRLENEHGGGREGGFRGYRW
ncbi:terminase large subunit domain-containing protein [Phenylobacterium sp.]|uniref:phage terminase large subunit family protein n=1 Tax=Phenylobacterium sp. TaxID=1871053 RepID=UPI00391D19F0